MNTRVKSGWNEVNSTEEQRKTPKSIQVEHKLAQTEQKGSDPKRKTPFKTPLKLHLGPRIPSKMSQKVTQKSMSKMSNGRTTFEYRKEFVQRRLPYVNYMRTLSVAQQRDRNMFHELNGLCHV